MKKMNYCYECGGRLAPNASKCDECGKVLRRERGRLPALEILKRALCLFVSFLFLLSAFTPIIYVPVSEDIVGIDATGKFSVVDIVDITVASFNDYDESELYDSKLYKEFMKNGEEFGEYFYDNGFATFDGFDINELDSEGRRLFRALIIAAIKLEYSSETMVGGPAFIVASVVGILYMLVCVGAFILALISFIGGFIPVMRRSTRLFRYSVKLVLLCAVGALATLIALAGPIATDGTRLGGFALMGAVSTALLAVALWIIRRIEGGERFNVETAIKRGVAVAVCFAAIMLCFAPIYKTSVRTKFDGSESKSTVSFYYNYADFSHVMSDDDLDAIEDMRDEIKDADDKKEARRELVKARFEQFAQFSVKEVRNGYADAADYEMRAALLTVAGSDSAYRLANLLSATEVVAVIAAILLSLAMYESLKYFAIGKSRRGAYRAYAACGAAAALVALLLGIVYMVMLCGGLPYAPGGYGISIAAGGIFFVIISAATAFLPVGSEDAPSKETTAEKEENIEQTERVEA